ncbi:MAG: hypothetical protein WC251_02385 [Candidatus Izemoplasmatales bacterium]|jgi:hypothetical protein
MDARHEEIKNVLIDPPKPITPEVVETVAKEPEPKPAPAPRKMPKAADYPLMWFVLKDAIIRSANETFKKYLKSGSTGQKAEFAKKSIEQAKIFVKTMEGIEDHYANESTPQGDQPAKEPGKISQEETVK